MFQLLDFTAISASMVNYAKATQQKVTDFTVGSVFRTLIEAPAIAIDEFYQQMWLGLKEGIPIALYTAFGFNKFPATAGIGSITVTITAGDAVVIPAGTRFVSAGLNVTYLSSDDVTIGALQTSATIPVYAEKLGLGVDVPTSSSFTATISRFVSAVATSNFTQGNDVESDTFRKLRFIEYIQYLARSTVAALEYALLTVALKDENGSITESVRFALVVEPFMTDIAAPKGVIQCYIDNGTGSAPSTALVTACYNTLNGYTDSQGNKIVGWKAAGVQVVINPTTITTVTVTAVITSSPNVAHATVLSNVTQALNSYIASVGIGQKVIKAELIAAAMGVPDVLNFVMSVPANDVTLTAYQKATAGPHALS